VEKRAEIVYGIMVKRGIVIEEYEDLMQAPAEGPPADTGAPRPPGQTSGTADTAGQKDAAPGKREGGAAEETQGPSPPRGDRAEANTGRTPDAQAQGK